MGRRCTIRLRLEWHTKGKAFAALKNGERRGYPN